MQRKNIITSIVLLLILGMILLLVFGWQYWRKESADEFAKAHVGDVTDVEVGQATAATWYPKIHAIGSVKAIQGIDVSPSIDGAVSKVFFTSGDVVKAGHPLVQLDDATYQADAASALASYNLAKLKYARNKKLLKVEAIAQSTVDQSAAEMEETLAELKKSQAELNQTLVKAPFDGRLGLSQVSVGQYVKAGVAMVSLQQVDPVYVDFQLSEVYIDDVQKGFTVSLKNAAYPKQNFTGKVVATNATLNQATRTLNVRAQISNGKGLLVPGMFADVLVTVPTPQNVVTVPQMAINYSPFGDTLFKVLDGHVKQIYIKAGEQRGDQIAVKGDIKAGEKIVTVGAFKLQDGAAIRALPSKPRVLVNTPVQKTDDKLAHVENQVKAFSQSKPEASKPTALTKGQS